MKILQFIILICYQVFYYVLVNYQNNIKNIRKYVFNNFTCFLIIIFIFNILIIDKKILYLILLLLFNDDLFVFLKIGYEMEYDKNSSYIVTYLIRILITIYINNSRSRLESNHYERTHRR